MTGNVWRWQYYKELRRLNVNQGRKEFSFFVCFAGGVQGLASDSVGASQPVPAIAGSLGSAGIGTRRTFREERARPRFSPRSVVIRGQLETSPSQRQIQIQGIAGRIPPTGSGLSLTRITEYRRPKTNSCPCT